MSNVRQRWPGLHDYEGPVANPKRCLRDQRLQSMTVEMKPKSKQPWVRSGAFGGVYKFINQHHALALKVFTKAEPERDLRYSLIFDQLNRHSPPCLIHFTHDQEGILCPVNGRPFRWPTVIMDWVKGQSIDVYLADILKRNGKLENGKLCRKWAEMMLSLAQSQIAHGDLQQGNILVLPDGNFKLVDYDGMFVPAMRQRKLKAPERGLPSYQHPKRSGGYFDERLDDFSALVILLTFACIDGNLWKTFNPNNDDKYILIHKDDFLNPSQSQLMNLLTNSPDVPLKKLAKILLAAAKGPLDGIPRFASVLEDKDVKQILEPGWQPAPFSAPRAKKEPRSSALKCVRCRREIGHTHVFCGHCGEPIPGRTVHPPPPPPPIRLSSKQEQLLSMFVGGLSEQQMADKLGIAMADVANQFGIAMGMVGVNSYSALKDWALRYGIQPYVVVTPPPPPPVDPSKQQQKPTQYRGCVGIAIFLAVGIGIYIYNKNKSPDYSPPPYTPPPPAIETPLGNQDSTPPVVNEPPPVVEQPPIVQPQVTNPQNSGTAIQQVWIEHNVPCGAEMCLVVHTNLQVSRADSTQARLIAYFWMADGAEMPAQRNDYNLDGQAGFMYTGNVDYDLTYWNDLKFTIPVSAIAIGPNHFATVEIYDVATSNNLGVMKSQGFDKW